jgi:sigma-B regulation protein RsbU (phosphoserine phosphatase)
MTTAAVVAYYSQESEVRVSYAGHPPVLYRRVTDKVWTYAKPPSRKDKTDGRSLNIPLAVDLDTIYGQFTIPMATGDRLFIYTDGIIDTPNAMGENFGFTRLKDILDANTKVTLSELKTAVLSALLRHTGNDLSHDDITMIVLEIT